MRYAFIEAHRCLWSLWVMCRALRVSKSGYSAWRSRPESQRSNDDRVLRTRITAIHAENRSVYGSPRIHEELKDQGTRVGRKRVARLMREAGVSGTPPRRFVKTTDSNHDRPVAENLLEQDFTAETPDSKWVADITYVPTEEGWLFLAAVLDLYSRRIVGWAMDARMQAPLVLRALDMALANRSPGPDLIHHSDRGSQYASQTYRDRLDEQNISVSMSRRACCYDNATMESFFHTLKVELVHRTRFATRDQAKQEIFDYIEVFYNRRRRHSSLGYLSPVQFEAMAA